MSMIIRFFQSGGPFMIPIALVFTVGLAIAIERYIYLARAGSANRRDFNSLLPLMQQGDLKQIKQATDEPGSAISHVINVGLARMTSTRRRADVEYAMEESLMEAMPAIEKRTPYLATFANIATLLGLLGTIMGLIAAFTAVANADPAEKATLLSQSISIAMNTTAFGLMVAIPLLLVHAHLQGKTKEIIENLDIAMVKFLNFIERANQAAAAKAKS
ncbi:MAG: MotA/TolQ/ExbB proton channel family protein [Pseudomonadota bacterium]